MKRILLLVTGLAVSLCFGDVQLFAQHGGGHGGGAGGGMGTGEARGGAAGNRGMGRAGDETGMRPTGSSLAKESPTTILSRNTKLASKLGSLLPPGTNLNEAASGFKNLGQFVAAVHVSHNLGITFNDLKEKMMSGDSLGKAIHTLHPTANTKEEVSKAHKQTKQDLDEAASESASNS
jgi:hypothetical protein